MTIAGSIARQTAPEAIANWRARRRRVVDRAFAPKSRLSLSEWADKYRYLSADLGEPGRWHTSRVPYMKAIMDAITDIRVRRVSVMKPTRIGATQAIVLNTFGYCVHQDPCPIIIGLPTADDANKFARILLEPMIEATPIVRELIEAQRGRGRGSKMLQKNYLGGPGMIIGTTTPRTMRMVHGRYVFKSEVDAWVLSADEDGDPYNLIDKRAGGYGAPKFVEESTPLVKEFSRIERAFEKGSREFFHVPCPHCREYQRLVWGSPDVHYGMKWTTKDNGEPDLDSIHYVCQPNGCKILESSKHAIVTAGDWNATRPEQKEHRSFHLNALVSLFPGARWRVLVEEFAETKHKPEKVRVFVNCVLGETFVEKGEQADASSVAERRREGWFNIDAPVPVGAAVLTRSVDTQGDRLETAVWAWGVGEENWLIDYELIPGSPATPEPWLVLDQRLSKSYRHPSGRELIPAVTFVDAGGHHSKEVHAFTREHQMQGVYSIFGSKNDRAPLLSKPTRNNNARVIQYEIGVSAAKEALLARLERILDLGPGYIHLPHWLDDEQVHQLTAEKLIRIGDRRLFKKTRERNELTDLWVYGLAGLHKLGTYTLQNMASLVEELAVPIGTPDAEGEDPSHTPAAARRPGAFSGWWHSR